MKQAQNRLNRCGVAVTSVYLFYQYNTSIANTLDAVGSTPTASTISGVFILKIYTSKTIDANHRLAGFEPAHSHNTAGALFEQGKVKKGTASPDRKTDTLKGRMQKIPKSACLHQHRP